MQGLVTNQVTSLVGESRGQYAAFLSPQVATKRRETWITGFGTNHIRSLQGRMLYDVFLYRLSDTTDRIQDVLVECDAAVLDSLKVHLKRYQLRMKAKMTDVTAEFDAWHAWEKLDNDNLDSIGADGGNMLLLKDPRHAHFGWRVITFGKGSGWFSTGYHKIGLD